MRNRPIYTLGFNGYGLRNAELARPAFRAPQIGFLYIDSHVVSAGLEFPKTAD
jgi:hypothetical protein